MGGGRLREVKPQWALNNVVISMYKAPISTKTVYHSFDASLDKFHFLGVVFLHIIQFAFEVTSKYYGQVVTYFQC